MKRHAFLLLGAGALITACGPADRDPVPDPGIDPQASTSTATDPAPGSGPDASSPTRSDPVDTVDEDMSNYNSGIEIDVDAEMQASAAEGVWVTRSDWTGFGPANSEAILRISCGEYGTVEVTRSIDVDPAKPVPAIVAAGDETERGYWKANENVQIPSATMELYTRSPLFEAVMGADKIGFMAEGAPALIVPGDVQLDEQIAACRDDGTPTP